MWYHPEKEKKNMCLNTSLCVFLWGIVWEEYPQQTEEVISWPGVRCCCEPSNINVVATELGSAERETSTLNHWVVSTVPKEGSLCFYLQNAKFKGRSSWDTLRWCKREVHFFLSNFYPCKYYIYFGILFNPSSILRSNSGIL